MFYWATLVIDGEPRDEVAMAIYEAIDNGLIEVDDSGRRLRVTELGKGKAEALLAQRPAGR